MSKQCRTMALLFLMTGLFSSDMMGQTCSTYDPTSPEGIVPTKEDFPGGPPQCGSVYGKRLTPGDGAQTILVKLDSALAGANVAYVTVVISVGSCGEVMSWSVPDHIVIDQIVCKGGTDQNVYDYTGTGATSDGNLHCPTNASNKYAGFSHIDFCFHYRLSAAKTADAEFTRTYTWDVDKSCDGPAELTLTKGQTYNYPFSWTVDANFNDTDFKVTGTISIDNNTPLAATITSVSDVLSGGEVADVSCGVSFPYNLVKGATLNCTYSVDLISPYDGTNTVTVATSTSNVEGDEATADFAFGDPTTKVDDCITVTDDCTTTTEVCADDAPYTLEYSCPISYSECGEYTYTNTASFRTNNTETGGSDDCTVDVNVPCGGGCTLTQGYWKTHSSYGPAPYDDTWAQVGEETPFFLSGKTYYQTLWTAPAGNAYWNLAHQYIAAKLNMLNGASVPPAVQTAFNQATILFNTYTPAQIAALPGNNPVRKLFINLATVLDNYNNGLIGPGHCSEESSNGGKQVESKSTPGTSTKGDFSVYPNPASDAVQVDLSNFMEQSVDLILYNQLGAVVLDRRIERVDALICILRFDKSLPNGIYNLTLVNAGTRLNKSLVVNK